jgi:hypothetical protein
MIVFSKLDPLNYVEIQTNSMLDYARFIGLC